MGSGKTAHLIVTFQKLNGRPRYNGNVIVMKPALDTKNGDKLLSRNGSECNVDHLITKQDNLFKIVSTKYRDKKAILVDEAQFLKRRQIDQLLRITAELDIDVYAYGLRLNFNLGDKNFAGATRLLQVAHTITCIESKCEICNKEPAVFSILFDGGKVLKNAPTILISDGTHEVKAKSICARCYYKYK